MTEFFYYFSFAQIITAIALLLVKARNNASIQLFILLLLSALGYLVGDMFALQQSPLTGGWFVLTYAAGNALPGVFWLASMALFTERFELQAKHYLLASMTLVLPTINSVLLSLFGVSYLQNGTVQNLFKYGAMLLELGLVGYSLVVAISQWRDDLLQDRRYIRGAVIGVAGVYIVSVIVTEQILHFHWHYLALVKAMLLVVILLSINLGLFSLKPHNMFEQLPVRQAEPKVHADPVIEKQLAAIKKAMEQEQLYQQEGLTIAKLSRHLAIHEYKLRQLINGELNYRNFNDFLNFYRVQEVSTKLQQAEFAHTPVLTLALESGFRSLSSFNKAFKEIHQLTPTAYRKQVLGKN